MISAAESLKNMRLALGLDQTEFAKELSITRTAIQNYEKGLRKPKLSILKMMMDLARNKGIEFKVEDILNG